MKKNQLTMLVLFATMLGFTACSDDDKVSISTVGITTTVDTTIEGLQLIGGTYTFENVNTSVKTDITYPAQSIELTHKMELRWKSMYREYNRMWPYLEGRTSWN